MRNSKRRYGEISRGSGMKACEMVIVYAWLPSYGRLDCLLTAYSAVGYCFFAIFSPSDQPQGLRRGSVFRGDGYAG